MAERGGYQRPTNPAPVSGPGALSRRTDGGPADPDSMKLTGGGKYGESKDLAELQSGADMRPAQPAMPVVTPLDAPSARPDEPVTSGADAGPGPGVESLGLTNEERGDLESVLPKLKYLEWMANQPGSAPSTRDFIRRVKASI